MMLEGPQPCSICQKVVERYVQRFTTKPVTDDALDAPDGAVVDGWTRSGNTWHSPPIIICDPCDRVQRVKRYTVDDLLSTQLMIDASIMNARVGSEDERLRRLGYTPEVVAALAEVWHDIAAIERHVRRFEREVWFAGLQKIVRASCSSGMSFTFPNNGPKFLLLCSAGRCMMTIEAKTHSITLITAEDEGPNHEARGPKPPGQGPMGIQGIDATVSQAIELVREAVDVWKSGRFDIVDDKKVSFGL